MWYILGRSDDTIKIAGKRLGPAEVESVLVEHPDVVEAAAVGLPDPLKGQSLARFYVLRAEGSGNPTLTDDLKQLVAARLGKPLKPDVLEFVTDLPKTRNAKVMRRVIRAPCAPWERQVFGRRAFGVDSAPIRRPRYRCTGVPQDSMISGRARAGRSHDVR